MGSFHSASTDMELLDASFGASSGMEEDARLSSDKELVR